MAPHAGRRYESTSGGAEMKGVRNPGASRAAFGTCYDPRDRSRELAMREKEALAIAASANLDRIARQRRGASEGVRRLLDDVAAHLFDPGYGLEDLRRACGGQPEQLLDAFAAEVGRPDAFIAEIRLAAAMRLLLLTDWPVARISEQVGYIEPSRFYKACKQRFGMTPSQYRVKARPIPASGQLHAAATSANIRNASELCFSAHAASLVPAAERSRIARRLAVELHGFLGRRNPDRQLDLLRNKVFFGGSELFELLSRMSREVGRRDRQLGVRVAKVAMAAVEGSKAILGTRYAELYALAQVRLANALRLAGDLAAAAEILQHVVSIWEQPKAQSAKAIEAEILTTQGTLRLFQRRFCESRKLLTAAIEVAEGTGDVTWQVNARLQRAAVRGYEGRPSDMIPDLHAVVVLLGNQKDANRLQILCVSQDLSYAYVETGEIDRAEAELPRIKALCEDLEHTTSGYQLLWLEGLIAKARERPHQAESLFREAKTGFSEIGDNYSVAMAALEIAILCHQQDRAAEVTALVTNEVIPVLESLALRREALAALTLLRQAVTANEVTSSVLETAREALRTIGRDPARNR